MAFRYEPFAKVTSIRLLKVLPKTNEDDQVRLQLWEEADAAPYRCLSYTWGNQSVTHTIQINGGSMQVVTNLHEFLKIASENFLGESLWVDAICINQNDDVEKSAQVQRMGSIYEGATEVLVWLGNCDEVVPLFAWARKPRTKYYSLPYLLFWKYPRLKGPLLELCRNPYWKRAWITQELMLAPSLRLLCGPLDLPWKVFSAKIIRLYTVTWVVNVLSFELFNMNMKDTFVFFTVRKLVDWTQKQSFGTLLRQRSHMSHCRDPRDRVYSLLSLARDGVDFKVDYSEDALGLFWRTAEHFGLWGQPTLTFLLFEALRLPWDRFANPVGNIRRAQRPSLPLLYVHFGYGPEHTLSSKPKPYKIRPCTRGAQSSRSDKINFTKRSRHDFLFASQLDSSQSSRLWVLVRQPEIVAENTFAVCVRLSAGTENFRHAPCFDFFELWCLQEDGSENRVTEWTPLRELIGQIENTAEGESSNISFLLKLPHHHVYEYLKTLLEWRILHPNVERG